ncbi:MAG TPA: hypothetical protein VFX89_15790 [Gammaproteobacteria bacterium]|nr:hypothetical protein [Gammaproteobacteria bacterium]
MDKALVDRITDTRTFTALFWLSGIVVLPVLALGVLFSPLYLSGGLLGEPVAFAFVALTTGGAIGVTGWIRAHLAMREPERHGITLTLLCLAIGIVTALAVAAGTVVATLSGSEDSWDRAAWLSAVPAAGFAAAHLVWVLGAVGWMERVARRYRERTGRAFDTIPFVFLIVAIGLALCVPVAAMVLL